MKIVLTGAGGFLGWHTRCRFHALSGHQIIPVTRETWQDLPAMTLHADAIVHVAGINRAVPRKVSEGNVALATDVIKAARKAAKPPTIVYANSIHSGTATPYGQGKEAAAAILHEAADRNGSAFVDVRLPNLFGEHGRPQYNSFVATFIDCLLGGETPSISDRPIELMHAQGAAYALTESVTADKSRIHEPRGHHTTVKQVWDTLCMFHKAYTPKGEIPPLATQFDVALFNTYRAALFPMSSPIPLFPNTDARGRLVETIRSHGGQGQSFVSTTRPSMTRGDHFHLRKIERFAVLAGDARIALRRLFTNEIVEFYVSGEKPVAVDMPTLWTHNITNTGGTELVTQFWINELYDSNDPDTFWIKVDSQECSS